MKSIFLNKVAQFFPYTLMLIALTLPFSVKLNSYAIALALICWLIDKDLFKKVQLVFKNKYAILLILFLVLHVLSYFNSNNHHEALSIIERRGCLFLLPLLIAGSTLTEQLVKRICLSFLVSVIMVFIICFFYASIYYKQQHIIDVFFYQKFTETINIGAVYMASYVVLAIHIIVYYRRVLNKYLLIFLLITLGVFIILLNSKMMFLILCLGLTFFAFKYFKKKNAILFTVLAIISITTIVLSISKTRERISTELHSNLEVIHQQKFNYDTPFTGTSLRLLFWQLSHDIIKENNAYLFGVGTGDFQDLLNEKYKQKNLYTGNAQLKDTGYLGYGPHNQYIEIFLSLGIMGLILFVYLLINYLKTAYQSNNYLSMQLIIIFICFFVTESVLSMQKGIIFFTFFSLIFNSLKHENRNLL